MNSYVQRRHVLIKTAPIELNNVTRSIVESGTARFVLLALIVFGGLWLRLYLLGSESLWLDESTSLLVAKLEPIEMMDELVNWDFHPPAYFLLLHYWLVLGESEFTLRLLSAAIGTSSIIGIYHLAHVLFNRETAFYSAFLLAISPVHIEFSQEIRGHALLILIGILSSYALIQVLNKGMGRYWVAYAILATLGMYTHYFFVLLLLAQNVYAIVVLCRRRAWSKLGWWIFVQGTVVAAFLPLFLAWQPLLAYDLSSSRRFTGYPPGIKHLLTTLSVFGIGATLRERVIRLIAYPVIGFLAVFPLWALWQGRPGTKTGKGDSNVPANPLLNVRDFVFYQERLTYGRRQFSSGLYCLLYLAVPVLVVFGLSQFTLPYLFRYSIQSLPGFLLILALGLTYLRRTELKVLAIALVTFFSALSLGSYYSESLNDDWRSAAGYVSGRAKPQDIVLFSPRWNYKPFAYYSRDAVELYTDLPLGVDQTTVDEALRPVVANHKRVWVVRKEPASDSEGEILTYLDANYVRLEEAHFRGVDEIVLYDLTRGESRSRISGISSTFFPVAGNWPGGDL